ncbi:MAG: HAD family hydrolase [Candidatus Woesearchaeota archaeon]
MNKEQKSKAEKKGKNKALFIDVDHTIVDGSTPVLFLKFLLKNRLISKRMFLKGLFYELLYYLGLIKCNSTLKMHLYFRKRESAEIVNDITERFWQEEVKPRIFKDAVELINNYKREGYTIVMISATPDIILKPLEKFLKVDYNLSSKIALRGESFEIIRYAMKWNKYHIIKEFSIKNGINLEKSASCSDGKNDIPMLLASGEKIVVNPRVCILILALIKRWKVLRFKKHLE